MDNLDKKIKMILSQDINEPVNFEQKIKMALKKEKKARLNNFNFFRIVGAACTGILLTTGVAFATYNVYEKVWKQPNEYESYNEYKEDNELKIKEEKISKAVELEKAEKNGEIISEEKAIEEANQLLSNLGYEIKVTTENIRYNDVDSKHSYEIYYVVTTSNDVNTGIEIKLGANGKIYSFTDRDLKSNYSINPDKINEQNATKQAEKILMSLGLKDKYVLNTLEETSHFANGQEKKEWWITYIKNYEGITNSYDTLELDFFMENGELRVEQILTNISNYNLENNEIVLEENKAIEIAKEADRKISELNIKDIKTSLEFRPLNAFTYIQEQSHGTDDGLTSEKQGEKSNVVYNKYKIDSNSLRKVYNVKVFYDVNFTEDEPAHNWKEQFGREYFVDATTGEIIGGRWGKNLY